MTVVATRRHKPDCRHCARVRTLARDYRLWRASLEAAREAACLGYATEEREFGALPTFRDYLKGVAA